MPLSGRGSHSTAASPPFSESLFTEHPILKQGGATQQALMGALGGTKKLQIHNDAYMSKVLGAPWLQKVLPIV